MNWIRAGQFRLVTNRPGKRYIFRVTNSGKFEYNVPNYVRTKREATQWLLQKTNLRPSRKKNSKKIPNYMTAMHAFRQVARPSPEKIPLPPHPAYIAGSPKYAGEFSCASGKNLKLLGKGRQGIVFKGAGFAAKVCPRDLAAAHRREKQPALVEFDIHTAAFKACPEGVVEPYTFQKCIDFIAPSAMNMANVQNSSKYNKSLQSILFMEFCEGGSLDDWLPQHAKSDATMNNVITQVIGALAKIYKKHPEFRHNDLWPANVMVSKRGFLIGDFGWARLERTGTNPAVNTANGTNIAGKWGIGPKTDLRYDYHFFLNNIRNFVKKGRFPKTLAFLDWAIPMGYRDATDVHVNEWRLKYGDPCPGLPTFKEVLEHPYITGKQRVRRVKRITSANLVAGKARLRKVRRITSANLMTAKSRLRQIKRSPPITRRAKRVSSANLRAARNRLKKARPRTAITPTQLREALKKLKPGRKTKSRIPANVLKSAKFEKLIEYYWKENGAKSGNNFYSAWNKARSKAVRFVVLGMNMNRRSPSAVRVPVIPSKPKIQVVTVNSGRPKIMGNKGRMVYADLHLSMEQLKKLAVNRKKNIKGLRSKVNIARKIFS